MGHNVRSPRTPEEVLSTPLPACQRCGHPADWHRLDDSLNLDPTDPETPFRCIGYDCMAPGKPSEGCTSRCPNYQADYLNA